MPQHSPQYHKTIMSDHDNDINISEALSDSQSAFIHQQNLPNVYPQSYFELIRYRTHMKEVNTSPVRPTSQPYFPEDLVQKCCVTVWGIRSGFKGGQRWIDGGEVRFTVVEVLEEGRVRIATLKTLQSIQPLLSFDLR